MGNLSDYIGRTFILKATRYGALNGHAGKVIEVQRIPSGVDTETDQLIFRDMLVVETVSPEFPTALMMPEQFGQEVYD